MLTPEDLKMTAVDAAADVLARLVRAPSEQTDAFEQDEALSAFLNITVTQELDQLGLRHTAAGGDAIEVTLGPAGPRAGLLFFGYAMTHPAARMTDPFVGTQWTDATGRRYLRGRGASEQKGALTSALLACQAIAAHADELQAPVTLCISRSGETGRHDAARAFLRGATPQYAGCIVLIGTDGRLVTSNKGRIDVEVTVRGRAGHSSMPWAAVNALDGARVVLERLDGLDLGRAHPHLGQATLVATSLHTAPPATHTIPDEARLVIDRRLLPGDDPQQALEAIQKSIADPDPWQVSVEAGDFMLPSELPHDDPFIESIQRAASDAGIGGRVLGHSHGCIDAGLFNASGIPAVMLGAGDQAMWHTNNESVVLSDVSDLARLYAALALRMAS